MPSAVEAIWPVAMPSDGSDDPSGSNTSASRNADPKSCSSCSRPPTWMPSSSSTSSSESPRSSLNAHSRIGSPDTSGGSVAVPWMLRSYPRHTGVAGHEHRLLKSRRALPASGRDRPEAGMAGRPTVAMLTEEVEQQGIHHLGGVQLHPVPDAVETLVAPRAGHMR